MNIKPEFKFTGIEQRENLQQEHLLFSTVHALFGSLESPVGYININLTLPVSDRGQSLSALRQESLAAARAIICTEALQAWIAAQELASE